MLNIGARVFAIIFLMFAMATTATAGARFALVVGNSDYEYIGSLANPANDAALISSTLEKAGFTVTTILNADQRTLKRALLNYTRLLRREEVEASLFFFAGHGVQVDGQNYLLPTSADITSKGEVEDESIDVNSFLRRLDEANSTVNIVILDACRNNPFKGDVRSLILGGLAPVDAPKGTYVGYSTGSGQVARDGTTGNSPYTLALSKAILGNPGAQIEDVFKVVRTSVGKATGGQQVPYEYSSITGRFSFLPSGGNGGSVSSDGNSQLEKDFNVSLGIGSIPVWELFLTKYGNQSANFNVQIAQSKLAALKADEEARKGSTLSKQQQSKVAVLTKPKQGLETKSSIPNMALYKSMLVANKATGWISFRNYNGQQLVYFTALQTMHCGLKEIRYSFNSMALDQRMPLLKCNPQRPFSLDFETPEGSILLGFPLDKIQTIAVQIVWKDKYETESDVAVYEPCKDVGDGTCAWQLE